MVRRFLIFGFRCVVCTLLLKSGCKPAQKHPCDFVVNYEEFIQPSFPAWFKASKPLGTSIIWNCSNDNCHWEEKIAIEKAPLASALVIVLPCCSLQVTLTKICWYSLLLNLILKMSKKSVTIVKESVTHFAQQLAEQWLSPWSWSLGLRNCCHPCFSVLVTKFNVAQGIVYTWSQRNLSAKNAIMITVVTKRALSAKVQI